MRNGNTIRRAQLVREMLEAHYQPGRQDRCKLWVLRNVIRKTYPISDSTFFRYLRRSEEPVSRVEAQQRDLFSGE